MIEFVAGQAANSPEPSWLERAVPLAWPQAARVGWWLAVAVAAAGHRLLGDRAAGRHPRWAIATLFALPFVVFAGGISAGTGWSTFH